MDRILINATAITAETANGTTTGGIVVIAMTTGGIATANMDGTVTCLRPLTIRVIRTVCTPDPMMANEVKTIIRSDLTIIGTAMVDLAAMATTAVTIVITISKHTAKDFSADMIRDTGNIAVPTAVATTDVFHFPGS